MMGAGERVCGAQELPSGDLRAVKTEAAAKPETPDLPDRDSTSLSVPAFPPMAFGMSAISRPLRMGTLPVPGGPMTAYDRYNLQLGKISGGLYPSMQRNFSAQIYTPSRGEMMAYTVLGLFLTPYNSVPFGYWAFNPSFPLASLTKIPDYRDFGNMYDPSYIPQLIRTVRDEKSGIYVQEAIPWEEAYKNVNGWHLGGTDITPVNVGPITPVERDIQRINKMR